MLCEVVVEANRQWIVLEDERRSQFVLDESVDAQNAWTLQCFQKLELTQGGSLDCLAIFFRDFRAHEVQPHPPCDVRQLDMCHLPILIARSFTNELVKDVVTHLAATLRRSNTSLFHGLTDDLGGWAIVRSFGIWLEPRTVSSLNCRHDP